VKPSVFSRVIPALIVCCAGIIPALAADPHIVREDIEWLDIWMPDTNVHDLPRVLLIGDSITRAYNKPVEARLKGKAYVSRIATSKSLGDPVLLEEVALVLKQQKFDVIHFNNGMHGFDYTEEEYAAAWPRLLARSRRHQPNAKLIWATTTDVRVNGELNQVAPRTDRVMRRNALTVALAGKQNIPIDDLFTLVKDHPEYHVADGVHFNPQGVDVQAAQVAASIEKLLPAK
jgi:hypothetical protein